MRVQAYRNLNRATWTIRVAGKVQGYQSEVYLADVEFRVSEKRRQACIKAGVREVHAYVVGEQVSSPAGVTWHRFTYNPFRDSSFVDCATGAPIWHAHQVKLSLEGKAYYQP